MAAVFVQRVAVVRIFSGFVRVCNGFDRVATSNRFVRPTSCHLTRSWSLDMQEWFRRLVIGAAAIAVMFVPERVTAQTPLTSGVWQTFDFIEDLGLPSPIEGDGFTITAGAGQQVRLRITDLGFSGDRFNLFANNIFVGQTSSVPDNVDTGILDADDAFNSAALSKADFLFGSGSFTFTLQLAEAVAGFGFGEGAIRADVLQIDNPPPPPPPPNPVPEPSTAWLMITSFFAYALTARFRKARHA